MVWGEGRVPRLELLLSPGATPDGRDALLGGVIRAAGGGVGGASPPERCGLLLGLQSAGRLLRSSARAVAAVRGARSGRRGLKRLRGGRRIASARPRLG